MSNSPNTQPIFIRTPRIASLVLSTQVADILPTSTAVPPTLISGNDPSTAIESIEIINTGAAVATILNLYIYNINGTQGQSRLISQTAIPATTTAPYNPIVVLLPSTLSPVNNLSPSRIIRLPQGWELRAALTTAISTPIVVTAFGGDYA
jgi:hypothetical protein